MPFSGIHFRIDTSIKSDYIFIDGGTVCTATGEVCCESIVDIYNSNSQYVCPRANIVYYNANDSFI